MVATGPDGRTIAVAPTPLQNVTNPNDLFIRLFSVRDGQPQSRRQAINNQTVVTAMALGPNGLLAAAGRDQQVRLYDTDNPDQRDGVVTSFQAQGPTRLLRFSPLGLLSLARLGGPIELWDPAAQTRVAELPGTDQSSDVAFSPDGRTLATVGRGMTTSIWTIQDSAARAQLSGFDARPSSLAFGPDGLLAGGGVDGALWTWRSGRCPECGPALPATTSPEAEVEPRAKETESASIPSQAPPEAGQAAAAAPSRGSAGTRPRDGGRGGQRLGGPLGTARVEDRPTALAFDDRGRLVVHEIAGFRIWPSGSIIHQPEPALQPLPDLPQIGFRVPLIARSDNGRTMALLRVNSVFLWHADAPDRMVRVIPPSQTGPAAPTPATSAPGPGRLVASGSDRPRSYRSIQLAPGGKRLYLIESTRFWTRLHAWDLTASPGDSEVRASEAWSDFPGVEGATSLTLRPDGRLLAVGDRTGSVTLLDTVRHARIGTIRPSSGESETYWFTMAFSPDGGTMAVGSQQGLISIYSLDIPGRPILRFRLTGHRGPVTNLVFDAQGTRLASSGMDPLVEVWDVNLIRRELERRGLAADPG